ncbi:MAG: hypothetical protein ACLP7P_09705 [Rhodomicrobium sp.]
MSTLRQLYGLACPKCGQDEALKIAITCFAYVSDEGSEELGNHEWTDGSACICPDCKHAATVLDFMATDEVAP